MTQHIVFIDKSCSSNANTSLASEEILRIFWKLKVHYRIHKKPPLILFWARSIQLMPTFYFFKIRFNYLPICT
jgi:hypothetical protein